MFNAAFDPKAPFPDAATRQQCLAQMRRAYCAKMLEECAIPEATLSRLLDPHYLPSREEIVNAFQLDIPAANHHSRAEANVEADMQLMMRISQMPAESRCVGYYLN
jgi:hypothetical protein